MYLSQFVVVASLLHNVVSSELSRGQHISSRALEQIMGRQVELCKKVTIKSCSLSCGAGYQTCVSWPTCYNPSAGESCCSNGKYCEAGYYCTSAGCCPDGVPLSQCGAARTLSVIPPGAVAEPTAADDFTSTRTSVRLTGTLTRPTTTSRSITTTESTESDDDFTTSSRSTTSSSSTTTSSRLIASGSPTSVSRSLAAVPAATSVVATGATGDAGTVKLGAVQAMIGGLALLMAL